MRRPRSRGPIASALVVAAGLLLALARFFGNEAHAPTDATPRPPRAEQPAPTSAPAAAGTRDDALKSQIDSVIESMDRSGRPPDGVAQGGRKNGPKGVFDNRGGVLPRKAPGYYTETDVWPKVPGRNRGAERLVFGRAGEVYYTSDHYRTFSTVRGARP